MLRWTQCGQVISIDEVGDWETDNGYFGYAIVNPFGNAKIGIPSREDRRHAERIVACVNALNGVKDPIATLPEVHDAVVDLLDALRYYDDLIDDEDVEKACAEALHAVRLLNGGE